MKLVRYLKDPVRDNVLGVSKECEAAQIISRRGVQLVATAHGKDKTPF